MCAGSREPPWNRNRSKPGQIGLEPVSKGAGAGLDPRFQGRAATPGSVPPPPLAHAPKGPNLAQAKPQTLGHASGKPRKHACSTPNHKKKSEICLKNTNISHFFQGGHKSSKLQGLIYAPGFTGTVPRWIQGVPSCCPAVPSFGSKLHRHGSKRVVHTIFLFQGVLENQPGSCTGWTHMLSSTDQYRQ